MRRRRRFGQRLAALPAALSLAALAVGLLATPPASGAETLRINGSTTVQPVVSEAAEVLRKERGISIVVDTLGGSSGGISALGDGRVDLAMSSRPLNDRDRTKYPKTHFEPTVVGYDALALVVSRDVWEGGVRAISRAEAQALYEGKIRNWKELGGPDRRVVFFNKEPGRGTWEVFAHWVYGDPTKAPLVSLQEVGSNQEGRNKVAATPGAVTQLSAAWADGERVFALAVKTDHGVVEPTREHLEKGEYPLSRPLLLISDGSPGAEAQALIDLLRSPRGHEILDHHGYLPLPSPQGGVAP